MMALKKISSAFELGFLNSVGLWLPSAATYPTMSDDLEFAILSQYGDVCTSSFVDYAIKLENLDSMVSDRLYSQFYEKWSRIYDAIFDSNYDILNPYRRSETYSGNTTNTGNDSGSDTFTKTGTDTLNKTGTSNVAMSSETSGSGSSSDSENTYGDNSSEPVPIKSSSASGSSSSQGSGSNNRTDNLQDARTYNISEGTQKSNTFSNSGTNAYTRTINGTGDKNAIDLIDDEIKLRLRNDYFMIVLHDILSVICGYIWVEDEDEDEEE